MFKALILTQIEGKTTAEVRQIGIDSLPPGEVLVDVAYSSVNYKDGLAVTGTGKIIRSFPMVPGVDFAGTVVESASDRFKPGDEVILTGWGVGERHWGGYAQKARVQADWLTPMPKGLDARKAMIIGTAGFTAMLCVMTLEEAGVKPDSGDVLVTGAAGGVGSVSVLLLSQLGYPVTAVTGRPETQEFLTELGAKDFIDRAVMQEPARPLETQRWAGAVDVVGGDILARILAEMAYGGAVAACGLANSHELHTTVMPFILRNVSLRGVDSVSCPQQRRIQAWERLAELLPESAYANIGCAVALEEVPQIAWEIIGGKIQGRMLVDLNL
ncbi:MDR family oxidoreductase [Candidatus Thiothrix sp. Deng01]|uniref:MDR family oxidoreductase n=1 Tax=Candidatus Thiothrix phosphatis TaxID=3112415 RepID=A0ABU6D1U7_9GAMM|nr:MDR family oxidoreductase [Candidatus Thiothrix sp. Deng01]MEB4593037.1 MDR family oxidoreductase [Candidatus Thiothrix sp. Deng01]